MNQPAKTPAKDAPKTEAAAASAQVFPFPAFDFSKFEMPKFDASAFDLSKLEVPASLRQAADLMEARHGPILALLQSEAGKTLDDAIAELREAVDFLRYYAAEIRDLETQIQGWMKDLGL